MNRFVRVLGGIFLSLMGLAIVVWLGLSAFFFIAGRDVVPPDDSDLLLVDATVPDEENTYVAFLSVTNLCVLSYEDRKTCMAYCKWRRTGQAMGLATNGVSVVVDRMIEAHAAYYEGLHRAMALPGYHFVKDKDEWGYMAFPPITAMMQANNLLTVRTIRAAERGEFAEALSSLRDQFAFGRKTTLGAINFVQLLVGLGITDSACRTTRFLVTRDGVPEDVLSALAELIRDDVDMPLVFAQAMKGEYTNCADVLCDKVRSGEPWEPYLARSLKSGRWFGLMLGYQRYSWQPGATRALYADAIRAAIRGDDVEEIVPNPQRGLEANWAGKIMLRAVLSSLLAHSFQLKDKLLEVRLTRTVIAVKRFMLEKGVNPSSLEALVPRYLAVVPKDPYAPDQILGYDVEKELIWSVGSDGDFNPFAESVGSVGRFIRNLQAYAVRLDGRSPVSRKSATK